MKVASCWSEGRAPCLFEIVLISFQGHHMDRWTTTFIQATINSRLLEVKKKKKKKRFTTASHQILKRFLTTIPKTINKIKIWTNVQRYCLLLVIRTVIRKNDDFPKVLAIPNDKLAISKGMLAILKGILAIIKGILTISKGMPQFLMTNSQFPKAYSQFSKGCPQFSKVYSQIPKAYSQLKQSIVMMCSLNVCSIVTTSHTTPLWSA